MMDAMLTTGMLRTIAPDAVFLFGLTAGTNKPRHQIPNRAAGTLPAFESTFGSRKGSAFSDPQSGWWWQAGSHNLGYHAFVWETILHGNAGEFGKYTILKYLPDKIARFLYEFHDSDYASLDLPPLELDRSDSDVHGVLKPYQVKKRLNM